MVLIKVQIKKKKNSFRINISQKSTSFKNGTILETPFFVMDGKAIIGFPFPSSPIAAPRMKST